MGLAPARTIVIISTVIVTATVTVAFVGGPEVGSAFLIAVGHDEPVLPTYTEMLSLPLLRIDSSSAHERPITKPWAAGFWAIFLLAPTLIAAWSFKASSPEATLTRWAVGNILFLQSALLMVILVFIGLVLPFACL